MTHIKKMLFILTVLIAVGCKQQKQQNIPQTDRPAIKRADISYKILASKDTIKKVMASLDSTQQSIIYAVNRVDAKNIGKLDTILLPMNLTENIFQYLPYPFQVPYLKDVQKIIFFSYPAQAFGAYENGKLVHTGPTSMGRKKDQTPTGIFYTNWKAEKTTSTFNDEWELKWNFNIENDSGIGFHQYAMPGYPASHSCLRLTDKDAQYLYNWADEWVLKGADSVLAKGTPVIVFGSYPFGAAKPLLQLAGNSKALDITAENLHQLAEPHLTDILKYQAERQQYKKDE